MTPELYAFLYALCVVSIGGVAIYVCTTCGIPAWRYWERTRVELNIIDSHSNRPARKVPLWQSVGDRK